MAILLMKCNWSMAALSGESVSGIVLQYFNKYIDDIAKYESIYT